MAKMLKIEELFLNYKISFVKHISFDVFNTKYFFSLKMNILQMYLVKEYKTKAHQIDGLFDFISLIFCI